MIYGVATLLCVTPAKAGAHRPSAPAMGPRLCGDDVELQRTVRA